MTANCWSDITFLTYVITIVVCVYGTWLFLWWWYRKGSASAVYIYVTLLLVGQAFQTLLALQARHLWLNEGLEDYKAFLCSNIWHSRTVLTLLALVGIVFHMTYRVITNRDFGKRYDG